MGLEEKVSTAIRAEIDGTPPWTPDLSTIRRSARRRTHRRTALIGVVAAVSAIAVTSTGLLDSLSRVDTAPPAYEPERNPTALLLLGEDERIPAGRYSVEIPGIDFDAVWIELDIPAGFRTWDPTLDHQMQVVGPETGGDDPLVGISAWTVSGVNPDPCRGQAIPALQRYRDPGPTVADLASALSQQPHRVGAPPRPVTLAGYDGLYLELRFPAAFDPATCETGSYEAWLSVDPETRGRTARSWYGSGSVDRIWILDVEGHRVLVNAYQEAGASAEALAAADSMLDSLEIEAGDSD
jgi:hypothetical protein